MSESTEAEKWKAPPEGAVCWLEIPAVDLGSCKKFYSSIFPKWVWTPATEKYPEDTMAMFAFPGTSGLTGGIRKIDPETKKFAGSNKGDGFTVYYFVESIENTKKLVEQLGGKSLSGREKEGDSGWYMYFLDVEGNRFGAYELDKVKA